MKIDLDRKKALRYIGYNGQDISSINTIVDETIFEVKKNSNIKYIIEKQNIIDEKNDIILNNGLVLQGKAIKRHLLGCKIVIIIVGTIGFEIDKKILSYQSNNPTKSIIFDSTGSAMIEEVMDNINLSIKNEYKEMNKEITKRFSPGYGDLPISTNKTIIDKYNLNRRIGLFINNSFLMSPAKSVTAIIGVREEK